MKRFALILLPLVFLLSSGCFEILEEIHLQKNGKGTYLYTVDMSALMDESMKELLQSAGEGEGNSMDGLEVDSVIYFRTTHAEEIKSLEHPEVFERAFMKMLMSDSLDKMVIQFGLEFEKLSEIGYFLENIDKVTADESEEGGIQMGKGLLLGGTSTGMFSLKGKKLTRTVEPNAELEADDEEMGMMSMFMESATFTTIYHLPGNAKKTTIPGAQMDGATVKVESSLLDMLKGEAKTSGWIKFR